MGPGQSHQGDRGTGTDGTARTEAPSHGQIPPVSDAPKDDPIRRVLSPRSKRLRTVAGVLVLVFNVALVAVCVAALCSPAKQKRLRGQPNGSGEPTMPLVVRGYDPKKAERAAQDASDWGALSKQPSWGGLA